MRWEINSRRQEQRVTARRFSRADYKYALADIRLNTADSQSQLEMDADLAFFSFNGRNGHLKERVTHVLERGARFPDLRLWQVDFEITGVADVDRNRRLP